MRYVFIFGCPRSGTTVLARLLASHPSVVLGIERFGRVWWRGGLAPELFAFKRFFDVRGDDTHYSGFDFKEYTVGEADMRTRFPTAQWVGDKIPTLYSRLEGLKRFPKDEVLLISTVRNVWDVCLSYQRRFLCPEDDWNDSASEGVKQWNAALRGVGEARKLGYALQVVDYDEFFAPSQTTAGLLQCLNDLFETMGLCASAQVEAQVNLELAKIAQLEARRSTEMLPFQVRRDISLNASFGIYRETLKKVV